MKIINITTYKLELPLYAKEVDGSDVPITLQHGEFFFTPTSEKTRSINLHGHKKNLGVTMEDKPDYLEYFKTYTKEDLIIHENPLKVEVEAKKVVKILKEVSVEKEEIQKSTLQDSINLDSIVEGIKTENKGELFDKSKEAIGANEEELYSDLNLDEIKKSVEEYTNEVPDTSEEKAVEKAKPKPRTRSKKGPGRPKKRGPKPKRKAPGRPKGSRNKKK